MQFNVIFGDDFDRSDVDTWCRQLWASLKDGGSWAIPRSGLIFVKQHGKLVLTMSMPYDEAMADVITPEQLKEQQDSDFNATVEHFGRVGVTVTRS